jgi:hypothetical protein
LLAGALKDEGLYFTNNVGVREGKTVGDAAREVLLGLGPDVDPSVLDVLTDKSAPKAQVRAAQILCEMPAKSMVPKFVKTLQDSLAVPNPGLPNYELRLHIVYALAEVGPDAKSAVPTAVQLFERTMKDIETNAKNEPLPFAQMDQLGYAVARALSKMDPELRGIVSAKTWEIVVPKEDAKLPSPQGSDAAWREFRAALQKRFEKKN